MAETSFPRAYTKYMIDKNIISVLKTNRCSDDQELLNLESEVSQFERFQKVIKLRARMELLAVTVARREISEDAMLDITNETGKEPGDSELYYAHLMGKYIEEHNVLQY